MSLLLGVALGVTLQTADTVPVYDAPATQELVERVIAEAANPPPELRDYRARVQSSLYATLAADSVAGGDLPASVDELVSIVQWNRSGYLHQRVIGHRSRLLIPLPYTVATILERPWVIPHLYGSSIYTPFAGPAAVNPLGPRGPLHYRYSSADTIRIRVQDETITLLPVSVRPRADTPGKEALLVVGTFDIDLERAAVVRARFGFVGGEGILPRALGRLETFVELENALWERSFWLPFQQRRDIVFDSRVLGGTIGARVVNRFVELEPNTGWAPATGERIQLTWAEEAGAFEGWRGDVGAEAAEYSTEDFADLRVATAAAAGGRESIDLQLHYDRGSHLFRYNRVEGTFLGVGARLIPPDPRRTRWELYGTAGWAFAEETARGQLGFSWGAAVAPSDRSGVDWGGEAAVYRRILDILPFRRTYGWDWIYTLPAVLWGSDLRDYYDATGAEAALVSRLRRWQGRFGARVERHDSVSVNTGNFLFGEAEEFGPLAGVRPGTHAALELGGGYALGPGAFGIGNSAVAQADVELGVADFDFQRLVALLSVRYGLGPLTLATRLDAGHAMGDVPPQKLFRFGSAEGLRGYDPNEFGGSTAVVGRGRLLVGLPPRSSRPLARLGWFMIPPIRPALVVLAESGWTEVDEDLADELARLGAVPTDGARTSVGAGLSILDDALTLEYLHPVGAGADDRDGRWYLGLTYWY